MNKLALSNVNRDDRSKEEEKKVDPITVNNKPSGLSLGGGKFSLDLSKA
jgi:hypothetical protein